MRTRAAIQTGEKLLKFVKSIMNDKTTLYDKTKCQLNELSSICSEIISTISEITGEESPDETNTAHSAELSAMQEQINAMNQAIKSIQSVLSSKPSSCETMNSTDEYENEEVIESIKPDSETVENNKNKPYSRQHCASVMRTYADAMRDNVKINYADDFISDCSKMLWKWFSVRYFGKFDQAPRFRYRIFDCKKYIYAFIIAYGHHYEMGTIDKFKYQVDSWLTSLSEKPDSNQYVAPYEIFQLTKCVPEEYVNYTATVIWDAMSQDGLAAICIGDDSEFDMFLSKNGVNNLIETANSSILESRSD